MLNSALIFQFLMFILTVVLIWRVIKMAKDIGQGEFDDAKKEAGVVLFIGVVFGIIMSIVGIGLVSQRIGGSVLNTNLNQNSSVLNNPIPDVNFNGPTSAPSTAR